MSDWKKWMDTSDAYVDAILAEQRRAGADPAGTASGRCHGMEWKRYAADPYVMVFSNPEAKGVYHLFFDAHRKGASAWMHLIVGEERALLVDTAFGVGDLRGLVETLTDRPFDVVNTHFHGDHSAGNGQFSEVWCHTCDIPYLKKTSEPGGRRMLPPPGTYEEKDVVPVRPVRIREMTDGQRFRLGPDHEIEVIHMPGHAAGGCMLLDHRHGCLFSGDAVVYTPTLILNRFANEDYPEYLTVTAFHDALLAAMPRLSCVRRLYPGHSVQGIGPEHLADMLLCCEKVMNHPDQYEVYDYVDDPAQRQIMCVGTAMIVYTDDRI